MIMRPHHLFCTRLYTGCGYSDEFCSNMDIIVDMLKQNPDINIRINTDEICKFCPNNNNGMCILGNEDIIYRDKMVLKCLSISEGEHNYSELHSKMNSMIDEKAFDMICGNCRWKKQGLCSYDEFQKKA